MKGQQPASWQKIKRLKLILEWSWLWDDQPCFSLSKHIYKLYIPSILILDFTWTFKLLSFARVKSESNVTKQCSVKKQKDNVFDKQSRLLSQHINTLSRSYMDQLTILMTDLILTDCLYFWSKPMFTLVLVCNNKILVSFCIYELCNLSKLKSSSIDTNLTRVKRICVHEQIQ